MLKRAIIPVFVCFAVALAGSDEKKGGDKCPEPDPKYKACRDACNPLVDTVRNVISGMNNEKNQIIICKDVNPCQQIILTNIQTIGLDDELAPCSKACGEDTKDCFNQTVNLSLKDFSIQCTYENELAFVLKLVGFIPEIGMKGLCEIPGIKEMPCCMGGEAAKQIGTAVEKGAKAMGSIPVIGKRHVNESFQRFQRGADDDEGECGAEKPFSLKISGKSGLVFLKMILDWNKPDNNAEIQQCTYSEKNTGDMSCTVEGDSLVGMVGKLATKTLYVGHILGFLIKLIIKGLIASPIFSNNKEIKEYIDTFNCGD